MGDLQMIHIRGDTFNYIVTLPSYIPDGYFFGYVPTCQIRDLNDVLIADAVTEWVDPVTTRSIGLHVSSTSAWPVGGAVYDVQFHRVSDNDTQSTRKRRFTIVADVTRP